MCKKEETKKITENHIQSHPVGIWPPLHLLGHVSKGKSHYHLCKLTLQPLITVLHLPDHHPQKQSVSSLPVLRDAKAFQMKAKHHQNIFTYANVAPAPSLFNKSSSGSMQKLL